MAKLITVTPDQERTARTKMEKLVAKDPHSQKQMAEMERFFTDLKERRDAEHAHKLAEEKGGEK